MKAGKVASIVIDLIVFGLVVYFFYGIISPFFSPVPDSQVQHNALTVIGSVLALLIFLPVSWWLDDLKAKYS